MKKHVLISALVIVGLALTGCAGAKPVSSSGQADAASSAAPANTLGSPVQVKQSNGVASVTIVSATYGPSLGDVFKSTAKNGGYLLLDVLWETASGTSSANPLYITVKDAQGRGGDLAIQTPSSLKSGDVPAGDKSRGNVGFDIGDGPYTIVITNQTLQDAARFTNVTATPR